MGNIPTNSGFSVNIPKYVPPPPPPATPVPATYPPGYVFPPGVEVPKGLALPAGFVLPEGYKLPNTIPPGYQFPAGVVLPPGFALPPGVIIPPRSAASTTDSNISSTTMAVAAGVSTVVIGALAVLVLRLRRQSTASAAQPTYESLA
jgi:hypothetical protein